MEQEQVNLQVSENVQKAVDYAFDEARQRMSTSEEPLVPFSVMVIDEGLEVNEHPGASEQEVHDSARYLFAQEMPEGYVLCYDGYVETDDGTKDAVIAEVADRGAVTADALAMLYVHDGDTYVFEPDYGYAGLTPQLYPAGTKPIVSGLAALDEDVPDDRDFTDLPEEDGEPSPEAEPRDEERSGDATA